MLVSKMAHMGVFLALYVLLAVEYVRFVYRNYSYLMGFDLRLNPVAIMTGLLFLAILVWVMFATPRPDEGAYAVSMIVAVMFCLPAIVMYQLAGTSGFIPLYTLLFLILLRTPLLRLQPWPLPRIPVRWQRWVLPAVCVLCLLPFPLAYGFHLDWSVFSMGSHTYEVRAEVATASFPYWSRSSLHRPYASSMNMSESCAFSNSRITFSFVWPRYSPFNDVPSTSRIFLWVITPIAVKIRPR